MRISKPIFDSIFFIPNPGGKMPTKPKVEEVVEEPKDKSQHQMMEMLRRMFLATIGAAVIAQEEVEALVNRLVERGEIAEKDGKKLINEMMDKRKSKSETVGDEISKNIEGVLNRMNIPSKADVDALSQKIAGLSKKIDELKKTE
jgi:polyhydroxyalkanoate synthesis regulator phasin